VTDEGLDDEPERLAAELGIAWDETDPTTRSAIEALATLRIADGVEELRLRARAARAATLVEDEEARERLLAAAYGRTIMESATETNQEWVRKVQKRRRCERCGVRVTDSERAFARHNETCKGRVAAATPEGTPATPVATNAGGSLEGTDNGRVKCCEAATDPLTALREALAALPAKARKPALEFLLALESA